MVAIDADKAQAMLNLSNRQEALTLLMLAAAREKLDYAESLSDTRTPLMIFVNSLRADICRTDFRPPCLRHSGTFSGRHPQLGILLSPG